MNFQSIVTFVYALIIFIGGVIGHLKAGSQLSLYMGVAFAILLILAGLWMTYRNKAGYVAVLVLICVLTLFFGYRLAITEKFMPAGMMLIISCVAGGALLTRNPYRFKD